MLSKKIKYTDFNGNEREQTFYFNISKAELAELEMSVPGGFQSFITRITEAQSVPEIADVFKKIILMSYGEKSDDGMRFIKKDPVRGKLADEFEQTEAYSELFMELLTKEGAAAEFIEGVIPAQLMEEAKKQGMIDANGVPTGLPGRAFPPSVAKG